MMQERSAPARDEPGSVPVGRDVIQSCFDGNLQSSICYETPTLKVISCIITSCKIPFCSHDHIISWCSGSQGPFPTELYA